MIELIALGLRNPYRHATDQARGPFPAMTHISRKHSKRTTGNKLRQSAPAWKWATEVGVLEASVDLILAAVARSPQGYLVKNVDRRQLANELITVWSRWLTLSAQDSEFEPHAATRRAELFEEVVSKARDFKELLCEGNELTYVGRQVAASFSGADFGAFLTGIDHCIHAAENLDELSSREHVRLNRPPKEWLVAEILPPVYDRCFGRVAGIPQTGYVKFAVAVMHEMGEEIKPNTITRARKDVADATRKPRRRKQTKRPPGW